MKKILVIGAGGSVGKYVIKYLLSEGKYEITGLDLKNKKNIKTLKKYQRRINIIYGDIGEESLIEALVKSHDVVINLASVMPPLGEFSEHAGLLVEYNGTENIIKAINKYNKNCYLIYGSTTSMYKENTTTTKEKISKNNLTNYSLNKYNTEELIKKSVNNYTILRLPIILNSIKNEPFMYNVEKNSLVEVTTNVDAAYAFVKCIDYEKKVTKKVFNVGMGEAGRLPYHKILSNILSLYGFSIRYMLSRLFLAKNYRSPYTLDSDELDSIIHYRCDSLNNYFNRLKRIGKKRKIQLLIGKLCLAFNKKNK